MSGSELLGWTHIQHHHLAFSHPLDKSIAIDGFEISPSLEETSRDLLHFGKLFFGQYPDAAYKLPHSRVGNAIRYVETFLRCFH